MWPWITGWTRSLRTLPSQCICDITASGDSMMPGNCPQPSLCPTAWADLSEERRPEPVWWWQLIAQSTMAGQVSSWLLQFYLLLLLVRPLDPSSHPGQGTGTWGLHPQELELQDMDPEPTPWVNMTRLSWTCLLVELLITGIVLGCYLYRRLWRRWREEKHQSPRSCCPGQGCPTKLIQLLRHNRAMLQLCLHHCSQQRAKAKRAAQGAGWKRRRSQTFPPASELHTEHCRECVTSAQPGHCDVPHLRR